MSSNLTSNNSYYKLSAYSLNLNGLDVQTEIDNLTNIPTSRRKRRSDKNTISLDI